MENAEIKLKMLCETLLLFVQKQTNEITGEEILLEMESESIKKSPTSLEDLLKKGNDLRDYTFRKGALEGKIKVLDALFTILDSKSEEIDNA